MSTDSDYTLYQGIEHLEHVATASSVCFDVETLQLQPELGKLRLLQLGSKVRKCVVVIDLFELDEAGFEKLRLFFTNGERFWFAHNAVFDLAWLQEYDIHPRGRIGDSMLASKLISNGISSTIRHGLQHVVHRYLKDAEGRPIVLPKDQQLSDWSTPVLQQEQIFYAARDVIALAELENPLLERIAKNRLTDAYAVECNTLRPLAQVWRCGLPWNPEELEQRLQDYSHDIEQLGNEFILKLDANLPPEDKLPRDEDGSLNLRPKATGYVRDGTKKQAGFNIGSPKQLLEKLTALLGHVPTDSDGKPSASRAALRGYAADSEIIQLYLTWKKAEKRRQMIVSIQQKLDSANVTKASYMQLGADTGRMSCIKPNLQQVPREPEFRACVQAPDGWSIIDADYSQLELRLAAAVANDKRMIAAYQEGEDVHQITADMVGCSRQQAKACNFGFLFGGGAQGLRSYAGSQGLVISLEEAADFKKRWHEAYPGIARWQQQAADLATETENNKWAEVRIPGTGLRRYLPGDLNRLTVRCNTPIQGAGSACLKFALIKLWPLVHAAGEDVVKIAAVVHDEILLLCRDEVASTWAALLKEKMEQAGQIFMADVPCIAEAHVGKTWAEVH